MHTFSPIRILSAFVRIRLPNGKQEAMQKYKEPIKNGIVNNAVVDPVTSLW